MRKNDPMDADEGGRPVWITEAPGLRMKQDICFIKEQNGGMRLDFGIKINTSVQNLLSLRFL